MDDDDAGAPRGSDGEGRTRGNSEDDAASAEEDDVSSQGRKEDGREVDPTILAWLGGRTAKTARKATFAKAAGADKPPETRTKRGKITTTMWLEVPVQDQDRAGDGVVALLKEYLPVLFGVVPNASIDKLPAARSLRGPDRLEAKHLRALGYQELGLYFDWTCKAAEFGKKVGKKEKRFQCGHILRHDAESEEALEIAFGTIAIPLCRYGIAFEIKRHPATYSQQNAIIIKIPIGLDVPYVQEVAAEAVKAGISAELKEIHKERRVRLSTELDRVSKMVVLVSVNYPPNTSSWGKVTRRRFAANSKRVHILETAKEDEDLVRLCMEKGSTAAKVCNSMLRQKLGQLGRLRSVKDSDDGTSYSRYVSDLARHTACNDCTSMVEVWGIEDLDKKVTLELLPSADSSFLTLSVRKYVMQHTVPETGKHPFIAIAPCEGGGMALFFSNYPEAEREAVRLSTHLPAFMMYTLVLRYNVVPAEAQKFVSAVCDSVAAQQALNMSAWDEEEGVVVMNEGQDAADKLDEAAEGQYFDFDLQDYMERNEGDHRVSRANMAAGLEFDPDAQSLGSMRTVEYAARGASRASEAAAATSLLHGMEGLRKAATAGSQATAGGSSCSPVNGGGTARSGPPPSNSPGRCGGNEA